MPRYVLLEKYVDKKLESVKKEIPEHYTDEEIIQFVADVIGGPVGNVAFQVLESNGDVRLYHQSVWRYITAVSEIGIQQMLSERTPNGELYDTP